MILRPPQSTRLFMSFFWLLLTVGVICLVCFASHTPKDALDAAGFFGFFWLLVSAVIVNQVTLEVELQDKTMTVSTVLKKQRQLSIDDVESAYCIVGNKGAMILRIDPKDSKNKPISFPINLFAPDDADRIKAFLSDKYSDRKR